jgi:hypothetical protein
LIACSVSLQPSPGKVPPVVFAARAEVSEGTVKKYLDGWERAIAAGAPIPSVFTLSPDSIGTFPLPERAFNGPNGYVSTKNSAANGVNSILEAIVAPVSGKTAKITTELSKSADAITKIIDIATPTTIEDIVDAMSDETYESFSAAMAAAAIQPSTPVTLTPHGVTPAKVTSPAKVAAAEAAAKKVTDAVILKDIAKLAAATHKTLPPKPDGWVSPAQQALLDCLAADELWKTEVVIEWLRKTDAAVLSYPGPLSDDHKALITERLEIASDLIGTILAHVAAKDGSAVPDTVPADWN